MCAMRQSDCKGRAALAVVQAGAEAAQEMHSRKEVNNEVCTDGRI